MKEHGRRLSRYDFELNGLERKRNWLEHQWLNWRRSKDTDTRKDWMTKMDYEKDKKWTKDIKMRYINTSNLEKIGDLLKNRIKTERRTKIEEQRTKTKDQERRTKKGVERRKRPMNQCGNTFRNIMNEFNHCQETPMWTLKDLNPNTRQWWLRKIQINNQQETQAKLKWMISKHCYYDTLC